MMQPDADLLSSHRSISPELSAQLDVLRGWSAIAVALAHSCHIFIAPFERAPSIGFGLLAQASVMVFFVLSGCLICKSITRNIKHHGSFLPGDYAIDRFNRIVPPFVFAMLLGAGLWWVSPMFFSGGSRSFVGGGAFAMRAGFEMDAKSWWGTLMFLNGFVTQTVSFNGPLWSLSYEIWYYVLAALLAKFRFSWGLIWPVLLFVLLGSRNREFAVLALVWFSGAALAIAHDRDVRLVHLARVTAMVAACGCIVLGGLHAFDYLWVAAPKELDGRVILGFDLLVGVLCASLLHLVLCNEVSGPRRGAWLARFSYTLYIIHFPLLLFVYGLTRPALTALWPSIAAAMISCALCISLANFVARSIESFRPWKRHAPLGQPRAGMR